MWLKGKLAASVDIQKTSSIMRAKSLSFVISKAYGTAFGLCTQLCKIFRRSLTPMHRMNKYPLRQEWFAPQGAFNTVQGVPAIRAIFSHMFQALEQPRFVIHEVIVQGDQCFLSWDFHFRLKRRGNAITIHGGSHLKLDAGGCITLHRDYWDAAEELYAKLPLIGALMRWLKRQAATPTS